MAPTLPNGAVVPQSDGDVSISSTGVAELRALGASVDAQLGNRALVGHTHAWGEVTGKPIVFPPGPHRHGWADLDDVPDAFPPDAHEHTIDDVAGLSDALDGKVEDDDPRLSDARTPLAHTHPVTDVEGLAARLAALEYSSGPRDITARFSEITAGTVITSRAGRMVTTTFYGTRLGAGPSGSFVHLASFMPDGFRPERGHLPMAIAEGGSPSGRVRIAGGSGQITFYNGTTAMLFYASLAYPTADPAPTIPPGSGL